MQTVQSLLLNVNMKDSAARNACLEQIWALEDPVQIAVYLNQFVRKIDSLWQAEESVHGSFSAMFHF
ncbi:MAG: hypothetical protein Q4G42_07055 [Neisseria sp.]|nr:hypothetical protein [Neisseria sp.]